MSKANTSPTTERAAETPDVAALRAEYTAAIANVDSGLSDRRRENYESRACIWPGQSPDGRKWTSARRGQRIFPWPGASDARVRLVDKYVREDGAGLSVMWRRMRLTCTPTESNDAAMGNRLTQVLRWMLYTQMGEAPREMRLASNHLLEDGKTVMGVFWDRTEQLGYETLKMEDIDQQAMAAQAALAQGKGGDAAVTMASVPAILRDPEMEEQAIELAKAFLAPKYAGSATKPPSDAKMRKVVRQLREEGVARYPVPFTLRDRPTITAFSLNEDVFLPPDFSDMASCRYVYWRELVSETTLRSFEHTRGWSAEFVEEAIECTQGKTSVEVKSPRKEASISLGADTEKLYEIVHAYRRMYDEDGVPGIWYTVFSPHMSGGEQSDLYAVHELLNYDHGEYPFVLAEREVLSRNPNDSRGYGEVGATWERAVKVQWDSRTDRTSMATLPPSFSPPGRAPDYWEPGANVETSRPDAYGFLTAPRYDMGSKEIEDTVRQFSDEYFGRPSKDGNPTYGQMITQDLANTWFDFWTRISTQMLQLMQQFMPDEFFYRLVGTQNTQPIHASRQDIQGKFDVSINFNAANLDREYVQKVMDLISTVLNLDTMGIVDRAELVAVAFELIEPNLGERVIRPAEAATAGEISDEHSVFAQLMAGVQTDIKPGQNHGLRKQVLEALVMKNPTAQQAMQRDPHVKEVVENRYKQLEQQIVQQQNKLVGLYGAQPSQQGPQAAQLTPSNNG
jgi:hypothetical protein